MSVSFVNFKNQVTTIGSTPTEIISSDTTFILDSILFVNLSNQQVVVSSYLSRTVSTITTESDMQKVVIPANDAKEMTIGSTFYMEPNDVIYSSTDFSSNLVNVFVSHRQLTEQ